MRLRNKDIIGFYRKKKRRASRPRPDLVPDPIQDNGVDNQEGDAYDNLPLADHPRRCNCKRHRPADGEPYDNFVTMYYRRSPRR